MAVVLAAGSGTRFGSDKAVASLRGKPLWSYSFETYANHPRVDAVGIIASCDNVEHIRSMAQGAALIEIGGDTRTESSRRAVDLCDCDRILIHDGARPFVSAALVDRVVDALDQGAVAVAPAVPVTDTIRRLVEGKSDTPDRSNLIAMQTPQAAVLDVLKRAYSEVKGDYTDEMAVLESRGIQPVFVQGEPRNFKVTTPDDMLRAEAYLGTPEVRTGLGYDIHPFSKDPSRPMMLGGILFEGPALDGHSDADVLLHAATDALLGAAGLGDIGEHFPNTDPRWHNAPSMQFLQHAASLLAECSWQVVNLDVSVVAEVPKIMPRAGEIRTAISSVIGVEVSRVSVKATTNEGLGSIGRREGIAAFAIATIRRG